MNHNNIQEMNNAIGLKAEDTTKITIELNKLLANYQVFYTNVRGLHWHIKGSNFFELHVKYEELYNDLQIKIDEIAERILTLDGMPEHNFSQYLSVTTLKEHPMIHNGREGVTQILTAFKDIINLERKLLNIADAAHDEGTTALMSDYIREQEKMVWMYSSYLG